MLRMRFQLGDPRKSDVTRCRDNARPHPCPMASQARHELEAPQELCAPRNVVPQERENVAARLDYLAVLVAVSQCSRFCKTAIDEIILPGVDNQITHWLTGASHTLVTSNPPPHVGGFKAYRISGLKPFAAVEHVGLDKFLVRFGKIDDALDQADQGHGIQAETTGGKEAHN